MARFGALGFAKCHAATHLRQTATGPEAQLRLGISSWPADEGNTTAIVFGQHMVNDRSHAGPPRT